MARRVSISTRIDVELAKILKDLSNKNNISVIQASRELAKMNRVKLKGTKLTKDIRF